MSKVEVLVVEDEIVMAENICDILDRINHQSVIIQSVEILIGKNYRNDLIIE